MNASNNQCNSQFKFINPNLKNSAYFYCKIIVILLIGILGIMAGSKSNAAQINEFDAIGETGSEMTISFKNFGQSADKFLSSNFTAKLQTTPLFAKIEQSSLYEKISQFRQSFLSGVGAGFKYSKFIEFISTDANLYFINTDMDMPLWLFSINCNVSKFDYFIKLKKSIKTQTVKDNLQIYTFSPENSTNFISFCVVNNRTYISNSADILKNIILQKTKVNEKTGRDKITISFNLANFQARMTELFKNLKIMTLEIDYDEKDAGNLKITVFEGGGSVIAKSETDKLFAAFSANNNIGKNKMNLFSFAAFDFDNGNFFNKALSDTSTIDVSSGLYSAVKEMKNKAARGIYLFIDNNQAAEKTASGVYTVIFKSAGKLNDENFNNLKKYFPDYEVKYLNESTVISTSLIDEKSVSEKINSLDKIKNIDNKTKLSYFYILKPAESVNVFRNILSEMLKIKNWKSSDSFAFAEDLEKSLDLLDVIDEIGVFSTDAVKNLNSLINVKFKN